jgi:CHAD domain-containing protein
MTRVAAGRAEAALERLRGIGSGGETPEAIHGARKDMKKLRTALRLVRDRLPKKAYREQNRRFRDASRELSSARDAEVKLETLEALAERDELPGQAVASWRLILASEREAATSAARDEPALERAITLIEAGLEAIEAWPLSGDSWAVIGDGIQRAYARGRRAMRPSPASTTSTNGANAPRTSGTGCGCCRAPGRRCSGRAPRRPTG